MQTPHSYRRMAIHSWFVILFGIIIAMAFLMSCTTTRRGKDPCRERRGLSGYGYGWIKCTETKNVFILDKEGAIICVYKDDK